MSDSERGTGVSVGTFDGVHRGHRLVVEFLVAESLRRGLRPKVITFYGHPLELVAPERAPGMLGGAEEKRRMLESLGAEVEMLDFDESLRSQSVSEWMGNLSRKGVKLMAVGFDNTFGCDGMEMSVADYRRIGEQYGIEVLAAPRLEGVSSSNIRRRLAAGEVEQAAEMLGYRYEVEGKVGHGKELGRKIGFPTANIIADPRILLPGRGVYAVDISVAGADWRRGVANIGNAPTVGAGLPLTLEVNILDFDGDIYDKGAKVRFLGKLRDERQFESLEELKRQIAFDADKAKEI